MFCWKKIETTRGCAGKDDNERITTFKIIKLAQEDEEKFLDILSNLDFSLWIECEPPADYWPGQYQTMRFEFVDENGIWTEKIWKRYYPMLDIVKVIHKIINNKAFESIKSMW